MKQWIEIAVVLFLIGGLFGYTFAELNKFNTRVHVVLKQ